MASSTHSEAPAGLFDLVLRNGQVVTEAGGVVSVDIGIVDGVIADMRSSIHVGRARVDLDVRGLHLMPGAIDTHTHWGYRRSFEHDVRTDTLAAVLGGTTTANVLLRFPPEMFAERLDRASENSLVDFLVVPVVHDEPTADLIPEAIERYGCRAFKFFLAYKDVAWATPGDDWNQLTDGLFLESLQTMSRYEGTMAFVHAENAEIISHEIRRVRGQGADGLIAWEQANPGLAEAEAIQRAAVLCEATGVPLFLVHLSGRDALRSLRRVRRDWSMTYGETCPHYLFHTADHGSPFAKFSPPVRYQQDVDDMWEAARDGDIECVGSDNSTTCSPAKEGDVWERTRGGPGAGFLLPVMLSEGYHRRSLTLSQIAGLTSTNAAKLLGLYPHKGVIALGADADIVAIDLRLTKTVAPGSVGGPSDYTLYDGVKLRGWPILTLVRGQVVAREGEQVAQHGLGEYLGTW